ncbi:tumor necrosis factor receptor superfamily member 5 [Spea bombifrons]|uniref:tumor necrosis factor receptor superfamily member 5 n=1 Tax=Spea bombifrons TaxID=233779 RepID=UPI002348F84D|nr:tumor necrosis factor receptor superfamily member 5 [Spea bombifrons]
MWPLQLLILVLLSCNYQSLEAACADNEYMKDGRCCKLCNPGSKLSAECTEQDETKCLKCEPGEFQSNWNKEAYCHQHSYCDHNAGLEQESEGTTEKDALCKCQSGRHCSSRLCETCVLNTACAPGHGVIVEAKMYSDTQCSPCTHGTFSNVTSDTKPCQEWTRCDTKQKEVSPGTSTSDVICEPMSGNNTIIYIVAVLCLLLTIGILYGIWRYRKKIKNKMETEQIAIHHREVLLDDERKNNVPVEDQDPVQETIVQGKPVAQEQGKDCRISQEEV